MTPSESKNFPTIETALTSEQVFGRLKKLSKQGKLAGFEHTQCSSHAVVDAHGTPFDYDLRIEHAGNVIEFSMNLRKKLPTIFAVLLIVTVWPGLPLTDAFLLGFGWYERLVSGALETWMWYLPLTVIPIPFVWRSSMKKSQQSAREHAHETIEKIRTVIADGSS